MLIYVKKRNKTRNRQFNKVSSLYCIEKEVLILWLESTGQNE